METPLYDIPLKKIDGSAATLDEHRGEVLLLVNVASKCGLTPQYEAPGKVVRRFSPDTTPNAPKVIEAIEAELAKP